jgi:proteasome accessory factor B
MAGRKKGKFQQTVRVLGMLDELRLHHAGMTLDELAEHFEVDPKTVRRDLAVLQEAGHEIELAAALGEGTRVRLLDPPLKVLTLTLSERYALLAVRRVFDVLEHTPLHEDVRSVYAKIAAGMPAERRAKMETLDERFVYIPDGGRKLYAQTGEVLEALLSGVLYGAQVSYRYVNAQGKAHENTLSPYAMALYRHGLYVVGLRDNETMPRVFAVERFQQATYHRLKHFERPKDFRVADFFEGAFGIFARGERTKVVVELSAQVADAVRGREWHPTQELADAPDGAVRLTFEVSNMTQVLPWVLSWGAHARVLEPKTLVDEVAQAARKMLGGPGLAVAKPKRKPRIAESAS